MLTVNAYVMDLVSGQDKWIMLPTDDLAGELSDFDQNEVMIVDHEEMPFDLGDDVQKANEALKLCIANGIEDPDELGALCSAIGASYISDDDVLEVLEAGEFLLYPVRFDWPHTTDTERAAIFLATEKYIPFGDLKESDLILVEDKLVDYIDWDAAWDDYESQGWTEITVRGTLFVIINA